MPTCRLCGKGAQEIQGYLARVNEFGVAGVWECRPSCEPGDRTFEDNIMDSITSNEEILK